MIKRYDMIIFDITWKIKKQFTDEKESNREIKTPNEFVAEERDASKNYLIDHEDFIAVVDKTDCMFIYLDAAKENVLDRVLNNITTQGKRSMKIVLYYRSSPLVHLIQRFKAQCGNNVKKRTFHVTNQNAKKTNILHAYCVGLSCQIMSEQNYMIPPESKKLLLLLSFLMSDNFITDRETLVWESISNNCWPRLNLWLLRNSSSFKSFE